MRVDFKKEIPFKVRPLDVVVVVFVLCAMYVAIVPVRLSRGNPKIPKAKSDLAVLAAAIDQFKLDCGRYPTNREGFGALMNPPNSIQGWKGPYLTELHDDPWGEPFRYRTPGQNGKDGYLVESYGADGKPDGDGDDADLFDGVN